MAMVTGDDLALIGRTRLFAHVDRAILKSVVGPGSVRVIGKGQTLFRQGDDASHIFAVLDGWMKIYRDTPQGEHAVIGVFGPGETFAEAAGFLAGTYPANAEAVETARLCAISYASLKRHIAEDPALAFSMLGSMAWHLHDLVGELEHLKTRNAEQRLGLFLLAMCGDRVSPGIIRLPYEKSLIAARLGMTPESLSRCFSRLAKIGVKSDGRTVEIEDSDRLRTHCGQ